MKIGIIGAGAQGFATASIFTRIKEVDQIILCDNNRDILMRVGQKINAKKIIPYELDAADSKSMARELHGCAVLIDLLPPRLAPAVMKAAIAVKSHYINSAFEQPFWNELVNNLPLSFDAEFKKIKKTALLGCGNSPGFVNVFVRKYCDTLDTVKSIKIVGASASDYINKDSPWIQNWSPEQSLRDYFTKPCILENGKFRFPDIFSNRETVDFGCFGKHEVSLHSHEEVYSLPRTIGKGLCNCEFKYQYNDFLEKLSRLGFVPDSKMSFHGTEIHPFDVFVNMLPLPVEDYLEETSMTPIDDYVTQIFISGTKDEKPLDMDIILPPLSVSLCKDSISKIANMEVALPIAAASKLLGGLKHGIVFPEEIEPCAFLSVLQKFVKYQEYVHVREE